MARIEIFDDWGKLAETLHVVSADAKDLRDAVENGLQQDSIYQCGICDKFNDCCNMTEREDDCVMCCDDCLAACDGERTRLDDETGMTADERGWIG